MYDEPSAESQKFLVGQHQVRAQLFLEGFGAGKGSVGVGFASSAPCVIGAMHARFAGDSADSDKWFDAEPNESTGLGCSDSERGLC